jgi:hypothetical protein
MRAIPKSLPFLLTLICGCASRTQESGTVEIISFSPAEGTKIDCNTTIKYQLRYTVSDPEEKSNRTLEAMNNQGRSKTYAASATGGEISDQISGQEFYSNFLGVKCRNGSVPFSFTFSLRLANGTRIDSKTYLFDEVPNTGCLANTGWC